VDAAVVNFIYQFAVNWAFLVLAALGLIIILGMINIINLAHGEFIMLGAYTSALATKAGMSFVLTVPLAMIVVGLFGMITERVVIRRFYGNKLMALVATFGLSLILSQGAFLVFGPFLAAVQMPLGGFDYGGYSYPLYYVILVLIAVGAVAAVWLLLYRTRLGIEMRATMQNPEMARALGVRTDRIYAITFGIGTALAGLAGAVYAPTTTIVPLFGATFIAPAFIVVVIGGGVNPLLGATTSALFLAAVSTPLSYSVSTFAGRIGLMVAALVVMRILPEGFSYYLRDLKQMLRAMAPAPGGGLGRPQAHGNGH
jgi:branched-subunit amino acid ABC-type transport system permease component